MNANDRAKAKAMRALRAGATIIRGGHTGWFLYRPDGEKERIGGLLVAGLIAIGAVQRIDDRTSAVGEEYGIARGA